MDCKHHFIGNADGVRCAWCGLEMTHEKYVASLKKPTERKETARKPRTTKAKK